MPGFIRAFCTRHQVPIENLALKRPDIPRSFFATSLSEAGNLGGDDRAIPAWFQPRPTAHTSAVLESRKPVFLYLPWIAEHGDALVSRIRSDAYELLPFDMMKDVDNNDIRRSILRFARSNPDLYRQMVIRRLVPLRTTLTAVVVTFDWAPVMRIIVDVCRELRIPTILIPHESVFIDRSKYYWDPNSQASVPICDVILGWGSLQREIFLERGYPAERFQIVGAPKFDTYFNYKPQLTRQQFCRLFGLDPGRKIILFASQPLDSQLDTAAALSSQRAAILDLLAYCERHEAQMIVRLPPSKDDILGSMLRDMLLRSAHGAFDNATCYLVNPEEALFHCDVVTSINSTMLFEGLLQGRHALSLKYIDFTQIWERAGIPAAKSLEEAAPILNRMLAGIWDRDEEGMEWAAEVFGVGTFDGNASGRIRSYLTDVAVGKTKIEPMPSAEEKLWQGQVIDVAAIASSDEILGSIQYFLPQLLNVRTLKSSLKQNPMEMATVEVFFQWGIKSTENKEYQRSLARLLGKPVMIIEDGFIRSMKIGLSGEPGLSVIIDDTTSYYDATRQSGLERTLQDGRCLTDVEHQRAVRAIRQIVDNQVSKYNHAPKTLVTVGRAGTPKILVIDQRYGDQSVESGLANAESFKRMLLDAISAHPDYDILIKVHPDVIGGGKMGYYAGDLSYIPEHERFRVFLVSDDANPYALIGVAEAVFVVSSGMGFEALMAGKPVHCYGAPFYSGWGVTTDRNPVGRRTRRRSVEDIFHFAYIEASRYVHPETGERIEVEDLVTLISRHRSERG